MVCYLPGSLENQILCFCIKSALKHLICSSQSLALASHVQHDIQHLCFQCHLQEAKAQSAADKHRQTEIERRMHPRTAADFEILYNELEAWRLQVCTLLFLDLQPRQCILLFGDPSRITRLPADLHVYSIFCMTRDHNLKDLLAT